MEYNIQLYNKVITLVICLLFSFKSYKFIFMREIYRSCLYAYTFLIKKILLFQVSANDNKGIIGITDIPYLGKIVNWQVKYHVYFLEVPYFYCFICKVIPET